jgi:allantoin racemase
VRILVLNANTSDIVTEKVAAAARASASPGTEIVAVTGTFGGRVIGTRAEHAIGEHSTIALVARHAPGCDAVVIGVSYDTGLRGARELLDIPVVGMTEAGLLTACMLGGSIGIVTFGRRVLPLYKELVASYGLASRIAGWRVLESTAPYGRDDLAVEFRMRAAARIRNSTARSSRPQATWSSVRARR